MDAKYEISTADLAGWLRDQGSARWWSVDDDGRLSSILQLPCPSDVLADALMEIGGRIIVVAPEDAEPTPGKTISKHDLDSLSALEGDAQVFQLIWSDAESDEVWVLVEDTVARDASQASVG